tara:strand:+ start:2710 stop:11016 length:8307 start_codon:yes stop_codon:yes gene_type:complete
MYGINNSLEQTAYQQRYRVQRLVDMYRKNPMQFTPSQLDELKEMSQTVGIDLVEKEQSFNVRRNAKNLMSGFLEGFTTIPTGVQPKTTYEAISHSMGHLAGFAPGILSAPLGLLSKGFAKTGLGRAAAVFSSAAKVTQRMNNYSVPMFFGHKASSLVGRGLNKAKLDSADFLKKGSATRGILDEATTLGVASAVSGVWKGPDVIMDSLVHGGIAGGMFGGLGNFRAIGNYLKSNTTVDHKKGEALLKGAIGASMLGVPAYLRDDPVEMIIYETMLGGYFGYNARPSFEAQGGKFIADLKHHGKGESYIFKPETHPDWNTYNTKVQDYVVKSVNEQAYKYIIPKIMESSNLSEVQVMDRLYAQAQYRYKKEKPTEAEVNTIIREEAEQYRSNTMQGKKMEYEVAEEGYERDFEAEDVTDFANVDLSRTETPLEILRSKSKTIRDVYIPEVYVDSISKKEYVIFKNRQGSYLKGNENVGETTYGSVPVEKTENTPRYITMDKIYLGDNANYKGGFKKFVSPMHYVRNKQGQFEPYVTNQTKRLIADSLYNKNQYIFGGVKDKGIFKVRDIHIDTNVHTNESILRELTKNSTDPNALNKARQSYREGLSLELEWLGIKKPEQSLESVLASKPSGVAETVNRYSREWRSNVLTEAETNGYYVIGGDLSQINNLTRTGHAKNVIDWNKRAQLRFDKSYAIKPDAVNEKGQRIFDTSNFNYEIIKDINVFDTYFRKGEKDAIFYESWTDGIVMVKPEVYDKIQAASNLPVNSMFKPVIVAKMPTGGLMVVKSAGQRLTSKSDKPILDLMNRKNLDMVMFTSAAKHTGNTKPLEVAFDRSKNEYITGEDFNRPALQMPIDSVRINLGTYINPQKFTKPQVVVTQLASNITESQSPGGNAIFYKEIISKGPEAKLNNKGESFDTVLDTYRKTKDANVLKDLDIDSLSVKAIHDVFVKDANWTTKTKEDKFLAEFLARKIAGMDKQGKLEDTAMMTKDQWKQYIYRNDRILDKSNFDSVFRHIYPNTSKYFSDVYKKYIIMRYSRPKWETSGKVWLNGQLPHDQVSMKVNAGEIKLDLGMGNMKVNITTIDGKPVEGAPKTLAKAWEAYKNNSSLAHNFEFIVVRVPMDSLSGARLLKFTGFTKSKGHTARTHAKDDWYLGGADKDSDSAFIYQGFSEKVKDIYRPFQNEWGAGTKENPMIEKKSVEMDKMFVPESRSKDWNNDSFYNVYSQFNPSMRKVVAENAYVGTNIGMGLSAKNGQAALKLWDLLPNNYISPDGTLTMTKKPNGFREMSRLKMEMMNRSADSSNYANSINLGEYQKLLLQAGWNATVTTKTGKRPATMKDVYRSVNESNSLTLSNTIDYKAIDINTGRKLTLEQFQRQIDRTLSNLDTVNDKNMDTIIAKKMRADGVLNDIKPFEFELERYTKIFNDFTAQTKNPENANWVRLKPAGISNPERIINSYNIGIKKANSNTNPIERNKKIAEITEKTKNIMLDDLQQIASWKSIIKEGKAIENYLQSRLGLDATTKEIQEVLLDPIAQFASFVKMRNANFDSIVPTKKEGRYIAYDSYAIGGRDPLANRVEVFDQMVRDMKYEIAIIANKYQKRYNADASQLYQRLSDYADLHLLGSFWHRNIPLEGQTQYKKYMVQEGLIAKESQGTPEGHVPWSTKFKTMFFQSREISDSAIRKMLNAYSDSYKVMTASTRDDLATPRRPIWVMPNEQAALVVTQPVKEVLNAKDKVIDGPRYVNDPTMTIKEKSEALKITPEDVVQVELFQKNLKKVPRVAENFNDWFTQFTFLNGEPYRDVSTMTIKDVKVFNRWFKDIDRRFINRAEGLPPYAWRVDPRYMNEQMALYEGKVFSSFEADVVTSDGIVKRKIKNFTGSLGTLREMFRRSNMQIDKFSALDFAETERLYTFRKQLSKEQAHGINELVIARRNGEDITQNKYYKKFENEIFIYNGKTRKRDEMVDIVNDIYTKDFEKFGNNWLWAKDSSGKRIDFNDIDVKKNYKVYNEYLKYNQDGRLNTNYFLSRMGKSLNKGLDLPQIGLENLLRFQYEYKLEKIIRDKGTAIKNPKQYREKFRSNSKTAFEPIGDLGKNYFPRMWENTTKARQAELDAWLAGKIEAFRNDPKKQAEAEAYIREMHELQKSETGGTEKPEIDALLENLNFKTMTDAQISNYLNNIGFFNRPGIIKERVGDKPGWDRDLNTIDIYKDKVIRSYYKNLQSIFANNRIDTFVRENKFGKFTNDWADYMRIYVRDAFGHQSTFQQRIADSINAKPGTNDTLGLGKTLYYKTSDHRLIKAIDNLDAKFAKYGMKIPGFDKIPKITAKEGTEAYRLQVQARREYLSRVIHNMGRIEAKFNMMTLLANTGTMTANLFGGATMSISQGGLKNFGRSYNNKWLEKNALTDIDGNFYMKYKDPVTGAERPVTNKKELRQWIAEQGVIDKFIADEVGVNLALKTGLKGKNAVNFMKELKKILTKNPDASDATIRELANRYQLGDAIEKAGGWFMQKSERIARADAFITHALQYRERYGSYGRQMRLDDPAVIDAGLKGVEATQFLYHSAFRPAYMRTSLGKVLTRFKLFAFQSVRTRKELYRQAKHYGFEEGTPAFDRFKNLFLIDMFTMALGTAFAYSLFDTALPPPFDWVQETGEWLFGNKRERDRAFFGQWPYPIAPLNIATPPIARIPMATFSSLINNDWERFVDYHLHTMYPFGRIVRQVDKTVDEPYGTTFGRGMQQFLRLPTDKLVTKINKAEIRENQKRMIESELSELGDMI